MKKLAGVYNALMHSRRLRWIVLPCLIILIAVGAFAWLYLSVSASEKEQASAAFYAGALADAAIQTQVSVGGQTYVVRDGAVTRDGASVSGENAYSALRIAYAQALATRDPILGLPGVDPDALASSTQALAASQAALASEQTGFPGANPVNNLYPVRFLSTLATLEKARQQFIASGSDSDEARYNADLEAAAAAGGQDAASFSGAFAQAASSVASTSAGFTIPSLGGAITSGSLRAMPGEEVARMQELSDSVRARISCVSGDTASCGDASISLPSVPSVSAQAPTPAQLRSIGEITALAQQVVFKDQPTRTFILESSACLNSLPGPYYFLAEPDGTRPFLYVGDLFFLPFGTDAFSQYLAETYGASSTSVNPTQFYECPEIGADYSRIRTLGAVATFAQANPSLVPGLRAPLISQAPLAESDAVAYVQAALAQEQASPDAELNDVVGLALMYDDQTAGLEDVISEIAFVNANHASAVQRGVPFDVTANDLFLTHSALPTLYLADDPTTGSTSASPRASGVTNDLALYFAQKDGTERWSDATSTGAQSAFVQSFKAMVTFEGH